MIDFLGTPPFLRITLRVSMVTMHFHISQTGLFLGTIFSHSGYPREQFGANENCPVALWGCKVGHNLFRGIIFYN